MKKLLYSEEEYAVYREPGVTPEAVELLRQTEIGSQGAVYAHLDTEEHIRYLSNPTLFSLQKDQKLLGMAVFCNATVLLRQIPINCYYIRYFSASSEIRGKGLMKKFGERAMSLVREQETGKTIFYASIEKKNLSSFKVVSNAGYRTIREVDTIGFSRFFLKKEPRIKKADTPEIQAKVLTLLKTNYKNHSLVQFEKIFFNNDYYYLEEKGEILAGCQIHRIHWRVNRMPGLSGKIILKGVPHLPLIRRVFNPKKFDFLALEGIYFTPGGEKHFHALLKGLLYQEGLNTALFWLDTQCPIFRQLKKYGHWGFIHSFTKNAGTHLMASWKNLSPEEIKILEESPVYVSAFDFT
ncbi:MAG: GNAT family N-acetyltransferase [Bacteroides sp.]|nr:GNAT family N-acetyltransferase [Bacteroides sp.]